VSERPEVRLPDDPGAAASLAVLVTRGGRLPAAADDVVAAAGGLALVVGSGAREAAAALAGAARAWWWELGAGATPASLARRLAPVLTGVTLVVLPASPDGRDLAPLLAAHGDRPLVSRVTEVVLEPAAAGGGPGGGARVVAVAARLDDRVQVPVAVDGPAVVTLATAGRRPSADASGAGGTAPVPFAPRPGVPTDGRGNAVPGAAGADAADVTVVAELEPDPATMDLADARFVLGGGAGLAAGQDDAGATATFGLLAEVATALGASTGGTRVASDAGWIGYDRQIGTTGVEVDPEVYVAFGISGASQHVGGLGSPRHVVSVNLDPSCPMAAMADLALVTDARALLVEVARRLGVGGPGPSAATGEEAGRG
jgi:electron transfer flavoprotein alpha subunit